MIFTNLKDDLQNKILPGNLQKCINYTKENFEKLLTDECGSYDIGSGIKMNILSYETGDGEGNISETHLKNVDVQITLSGGEGIAVNNIHNMKVDKIDEDRDLIIHSGGMMFNVVMKSGDVLILFPEDVHKSGLKREETGKVRKLVFKVPVESL